MEETIDPTVKLTKLVRENNYEDAFNMALSLGDVAIVSWLCDQVGLSLFYDCHSGFAARKCSFLFGGLAFILKLHICILISSYSFIVDLLQVGFAVIRISHWLQTAKSNYTEFGTYHA